MDEGSISILHGRAGHLGGLGGGGLGGEGGLGGGGLGGGGELGGGLHAHDIISHPSQIHVCTAYLVSQKPTRASCSDQRFHRALRWLGL